MALQDVTVSVEKSSYDLLQQVAKLVAAIKAAHASGASLVVAVPADIVALVAALQPMIADIQALPADAKADMVGLVKGALVALPDLVDAAVK